MSHRLPERDRPWTVRTYAGHRTAASSNALDGASPVKERTGPSYPELAAGAGAP